MLNNSFFFIYMCQFLFMLIEKYISIFVLKYNNIKHKFQQCF